MRASAKTPPRLILVTDSARLRPGGSTAARVRALAAQAREAFDRGVDAVQLREPALDAAALLDAAAEIAPLGQLIVVERIDVAIAAGAAGVHLRGDGVPSSRARAILPAGMTLSRAVHGADEAAAVTADGVLDWVVAGTAFETTSKPGRSVLGGDGLAAIVRASHVPVVAIGGVRPETASAAWAAGVSGVAVIGSLLPPITQSSVDSLRDRSLE